VSLAKRIIPCLDVRDGKVVKGVRFADHVIVGEIGELARRYRDDGADELVFYDITASADRRSVDLNWVSQVGKLIDIPFCVAGGICDVDTARQVLHAGADKISINSPALQRPELISELARAFGSQCVVVGVDSLWEDGAYRVYKLTGSEKTIRQARRKTLEWLDEASARGAGEIVLNCMGSDGVRSGYDIAQLSLARERLSVPMIASGGAGRAEHFVDVLTRSGADGALAAGVFHRGEITIPELKAHLLENGVEVRP